MRLKDTILCLAVIGAASFPRILVIWVLVLLVAIWWFWATMRFVRGQVSGYKEFCEEIKAQGKEPLACAMTVTYPHLRGFIKRPFDKSEGVMVLDDDRISFKPLMESFFSLAWSDIASCEEMTDTKMLAQTSFQDKEGQVLEKTGFWLKTKDGRRIGLVIPKRYAELVRKHL